MVGEKMGTSAGHEQRSPDRIIEIAEVERSDHRSGGSIARSRPIDGSCPGRPPTDGYISEAPSQAHSGKIRA